MYCSIKQVLMILRVLETNFFLSIIHQQKRHAYTKFSWDLSKAFFVLNFCVAKLFFVYEVFKKN